MKEETIIKITAISSFCVMAITIIICFTFAYLSYNPIEIKFEIENETRELISKTIERDIDRGNREHDYYNDLPYKINLTEEEILYLREYLRNSSYPKPILK